MDMHKGFICALRFAEGKLFSGAKDGKVNMIDCTSGQVLKTSEFPSLIRAIDCMNGKLIVGQRDGTITCKTESEQMDIMSSHSDGEVWGLAQQADGTVVTSGDDNKVMMWNPDTRKHVKTCKVTDRREKSRRGRASTLSNKPDSQCSRSVAINDQWLAVAGNDGAVSIRACSNADAECHLLKDSTEWIEVMSFSPDGQYLAVGSHDNTIYVYRTSDWGLQGKCTGHSSYIMALDWCCESKVLRTNCGAYELLFFTVPDCNQDPSGRSNYKNTLWATITCKFLW
jgi:WD40 repeat protein